MTLNITEVFSAFAKLREGASDDARLALVKAQAPGLLPLTGNDIRELVYATLPEATKVATDTLNSDDAKRTVRGAANDLRRVIIGHYMTESPDVAGLRAEVEAGLAKAKEARGKIKGASAIPTVPAALAAAFKAGMTKDAVTKAGSISSAIRAAANKVVAKAAESGEQEAVFDKQFALVAKATSVLSGLRLTGARNEAVNDLIALTRAIVMALDEEERATKTA